MKMRLGSSERKFAEIIWREAPLSSRKLVDLAESELGWKKTTSYTVLKRLIQKGLFLNENSCVTARISLDEYLKQESREYIREAFGGSLPAFFLAFTSDNSLSEEDIDVLKKMIDDARKAEIKDQQQVRDHTE